jgi:hypothetical protein
MIAIGVYYGSVRGTSDKVHLLRYDVEPNDVIEQDRQGFTFNGKTAHMMHEIADSIEVAAETKEDAVMVIAREIFDEVEDYDDFAAKLKMAKAKAKFVNWLLHSDSRELLIDEWED